MGKSYFPKVKIIFWWTFLYYWIFIKVENLIARPTMVRNSRMFIIFILRQFWCCIPPSRSLESIWIGLYSLGHIYRMFCKSTTLKNCVLDIWDWIFDPFKHFENFWVLSIDAFLYFKIIIFISLMSQKNFFKNIF